MSTLKDFRFTVDASPLPRRRVRLTSDARAPLEAAIPPAFRGGTPGMWSPEDLLVASLASCYVITFESVAEQRQLVVHALSVEGGGHVTRRAEGRVGFVVIELRVQVTVDPDCTELAERVAHAARRRCLIGHALDVPIELELDVRALDLPHPVAGV